jgi:hypothetical protein
MDTLSFVYGAAWATLFVVLMVAIKISRVVVYIPNDKIGIVEKLWSFGGSVKLITKDAFEPILPLSFVIQIAYDDAPLIIQQFAEIRSWWNRR